MTDMISWLRQQLDTDEAHARKDIWAADHATPGRWIARYGHNLPSSWVETESGPVAKLDGGRHDADALLVARFRPDNVRERAERVLRTVQAHRAILDAYEPARSHPTSLVSSFVRGQDDGFRQGLEEAVKAVVSIYSDRDGYREEWSA